MCSWPNTRLKVQIAADPLHVLHNGMTIHAINLLINVEEGGTQRVLDVLNRRIAAACRSGVQSVPTPRYIGWANITGKQRRLVALLMPHILPAVNDLSRLQMLRSFWLHYAQFIRHVEATVVTRQKDVPRMKRLAAKVFDKFVGKSRTSLLMGITFY